MATSITDRRIDPRTRGLRLPVRVPGRAVFAPVVLVAMIGLATTTVRAAGLRSDADTAPVAPPYGELWIGTATTAQLLAELDPDMSGLFLGGRASVTLGGADGSQTAMAWASEAAFAKDLTAGRIPSSVRLVLYDPEGWKATPLAERLDPAAAMRTFGELARDHGFLATITPHPSLVEVPGAVCAAAEGEAMAAAYLRCGIQADAARFADIVEVQGQYLETDVDAYRSFVSQAVQQARRANPNVLVLSGISTNFTDDADVLYEAWRSVLDAVDGHYLNVPGGIRPRVAVAFLRMVAETRA